MLNDRFKCLTQRGFDYLDKMRAPQSLIQMKVTPNSHSTRWRSRHGRRGIWMNEINSITGKQRGNITDCPERG